MNVIAMRADVYPLVFLFARHWMRFIISPVGDDLPGVPNNERNAVSLQRVAEDVDPYGETGNRIQIRAKKRADMESVRCVAIKLKIFSLLKALSPEGRALKVEALKQKSFFKSFCGVLGELFSKSSPNVLLTFSFVPYFFL